MTARGDESALLARCSAVAREVAQSAQDQREANVFRLAAMVVQSRFPGESKCLMQASEQYSPHIQTKNWRRRMLSEKAGS